jgi:indoleacetate--lysine synthetase
MSDRTTRFTPSVVAEALSYDPRYASLLSDGVDDYASFRARVAIESADDLKRRVLNRLDSGRLAGATFYTPSGTSGEAKLLLNSTWRKKPDATYGRSLASALAAHGIAPTDRVVNLFTAGGFSTLYDGCNRVLDAIGANVLPVGRLDAYGTDMRAILELMGRARPNVLIGTPTSILQCMRMLDALGIDIDVTTIVYTGEPFTEPKRAIIRQRWPRAAFFGLYGTTETGFIGYHTPRCDDGHYHIFDDWFFLEEHAGQLLVTSRANPSLAMLRYHIGDCVRIGPSVCCGCGLGGSVIELLGRADRRFKYAGNLISTDLLASRLTACASRAIDCQFRLSTDTNGHDCLSVAVDLDADELARLTPQLARTLLSIEDIRECIDKGMGRIEVLGRGALRHSARQKLPTLIDERRVNAE